MKKFVQTLVLLLMAAIGTAAAQQKQPADSVVLAADIHCENCVARIEKSIPFEKGVKEVKADIPQKKVTVYYDAKKTDPEKILKGFDKIKMKAGFWPEETKE